MSRFPVPALALVVCFGGFAGCASTPNGSYDRVPGLVSKPWDQAPKGSWVRQRHFYRYGKTERTWEGVLRRVESGVEATPPKVGNSPAAPFDFMPAPAGGKAFISDRSLEDVDLVINGRTYACTVKEEMYVTPMCGNAQGLIPPFITRLRLWTCEAAPVPGGVLQWTSEWTFRQERIRRSEFKYTKIGEKITWQGTQVTAHEVRYREWEPPESAHPTESIVMVWSEDVPGRQLRYLLENTGENDHLEQWIEVETLEYGWR